MAAYQSVGFKYVYTPSLADQGQLRAVRAGMQQAGVQYVTEYSDDYSAERLLQAMQQELAPAGGRLVRRGVHARASSSRSARRRRRPRADGHLGLRRGGGNPGMQLFETWMNRVAPGYTTTSSPSSPGPPASPSCRRPGGRAAPHPCGVDHPAAGIANWTGGGVTPPEDIGAKMPAKCFSYFQIENGGFPRVYPSRPTRSTASTASSGTEANAVSHARAPRLHRHRHRQRRRLRRRGERARRHLRHVRRVQHRPRRRRHGDGVRLLAAARSAGTRRRRWRSSAVFVLAPPRGARRAGAHPVRDPARSPAWW